MLKIENVVKKYENGFVALKGVSFKTPDNGFVAITGASGSGKSTLLNLLACNDSITGGRIAFNGISYDNLSKEEQYSDFAYIYQDYKLIENITVYDNMLISAELSCYEANERKIDNILTELGLIEFKREKVTNLSGGQKQRVAIARALVRQPKVIFADEPTGNLDSENTRNIFSILKELSKTVLVILVTHDVETVMEYADRIIKLCDGKIESNEIINNSEETEKPLKTEDIKKKTRVLSWNTSILIGFAFNKSKISRKLTLVAINSIMIMLIFVSLTWSCINYDKAVYSTTSKTANFALNLQVKNEREENNNLLYFNDLSGLAEYLNTQLKINTAKIYNNSTAYLNRGSLLTPNNYRNNGQVQNLYNRILLSQRTTDIVICNNINEINLELKSGRNPIKNNECLIPYSIFISMLDNQFYDNNSNKIIFDNEQSIFDYDFGGIKIVGAFEDDLKVNDIYKKISSIPKETYNDKELTSFNKKELLNKQNQLKSDIENNYLTNIIIMSESCYDYLNNYQFYSKRNITTYSEHTINLEINNAHYNYFGNMFLSFLPANKDTVNITGISEVNTDEVFLSQSLLNVMNNATENKKFIVGDYIDISTYKAYLENSSNNHYYKNLESIIENKSYKIAGILPDKMQGFDVLFNNNDFNVITSHNKLQTSSLFINKRNLSLNDLTNIRRYVAKNYIKSEDINLNLGISYKHNNHIGIEDTYMFSSLLRNYISYALTIIFSVLFIFFVYYLFSNTIKSKAGDLLILKSLGARNKDFIKIFLLNSFTFNFIEILIGLGLGIGAVAFIDYVVCKLIARGMYTIFSLDIAAISIVIVAVLLINMIILISKILSINDKNLRKSFQKSKE